MNQRLSVFAAGLLFSFFAVLFFLLNLFLRILLLAVVVAGAYYLLTRLGVVPAVGAVVLPISL